MNRIIVFGSFCPSSSVCLKGYSSMIASHGAFFFIVFFQRSLERSPIPSISVRLSDGKKPRGLHFHPWASGQGELGNDACNSRRLVIRRTQFRVEKTLVLVRSRSHPRLGVIIYRHEVRDQRDPSFRPDGIKIWHRCSSSLRSSAPKK